MKRSALLLLGLGLVLSPSSTVETVGAVAPRGGFDTALIVRAYAPRLGALRWQRRVDPGGGSDQARRTAASRDRVLVSGSVANGPIDHDFLLLAQDLRTGRPVWRSRFDLAGGFDSADALAVSRRWVVAGGSGESDQRNRDILLRAHDLDTGALRWQERLDVEGGDDWLLDLDAVARRLVAGGMAGTPERSLDWLLRAYDLSTGELLWQDLYDRNGGFDAVFDVAVRGSRTFAAGIVGGESGQGDWMVRAYGRGGRLLWQDVLDVAGGADEALALTLHGKRLLVVGRARNRQAHSDFLVRAYSAATGDLLWQDLHDAAGVEDRAFAVAAMGRRVFAGGYLGNAAGGVDFGVRAYRVGTGELVWSDRLDLDPPPQAHPGRVPARSSRAPNSDAVVGLTAAAGLVYAAGWATTPRGDEDAVLRAYRARDGKLAWEEVLGGDGNDQIADLALHRGRLFTAGTITPDRR